MSFYELAPSGTPIRMTDLLRWLVTLPGASGRVEELRRDLCRRLAVRHCFFVSSGRAGMVILLRVLRSLAGPEKTDVIVPSYTCYSVPASVIRAGLQVRVLDIDPATLSYRPDLLAATDYANVLAVLSANLYGIPNDLPAISAVARARGAFFVDDSAQSLGATVADRAVGTFGDIGLYSLDKGKNITSIQGGILVTNSDEIADRLTQAIATLPPPAPKRVLAQAIQLVLYTAFLHPSLYWIPACLPFLGLGKTVYETDYPIEQYSVTLGAMAAQLFGRIDRLTAERRKAAVHYESAISQFPHTMPIAVAPGAQPVFLRYPLLIDTTIRRDHILAALQATGLGATASYPLATLDIPEIQSHVDHRHSSSEGGRSVAQRILTLPTHPYVRPRHMDRICAIIGKGDPCKKGR